MLETLDNGTHVEDNDSEVRLDKYDKKVDTLLRTSL